MALLDLPDEILDLCIAQVANLPPSLDEWGDIELTSEEINQAALKSLRSTCKRLLPFATPKLYSRIHLLPTRDSAKKARAILEDRSLMPLVNTISVKASLDLRDSYRRRDNASLPQWDDHDEEGEQVDDTDRNNKQHIVAVDGRVSPTFKRMFGDIGLFSNLRLLELIYDSVVNGPTFDFEDHDMRESQDYRDALFRQVLCAINHPTHPATRLHSLAIHNLQDCANAAIATSEDFKIMLSQLECLELSVTSQKDEAGESEIEIRERHDFYSRDLRKYWLEPLHQTGRLTTLKLYGTIFWGYLPKCDLRGLRFPNLKSLSLGRMTFTHDWQLDWIVSHGETLETLSLDTCPIIPDAELEARVDAESYPLARLGWGTGRGKRITSTWKYDTRWHHFFRRSRDCLPHLRRLAISEDFRASRHSRADDRMISTFFAAPEILPAKVYASRYCSLDGTHTSPTALLTISPSSHHDWLYNGPCQWTSRADDEEAEFRANLHRYYGRCIRGAPVMYPDCWDEDQQALDELLTAVHERKRKMPMS